MIGNFISWFLFLSFEMMLVFMWLMLMIMRFTIRFSKRVRVSLLKFVKK